MVKRASSSTTQKKIGKVRKARAAVMILLVLVALSIVLIDKKEKGEAVELTSGPQSSSEMNVATTANSIYGIGVPSASSIAQNVDSSKANLSKISQRETMVIPMPTVRPVRSRLAEVKKGRRVSSVAQKTAVLPAYHQVTSGDTLSGIAGKYYGKTSLWRNIYNANRDVLRSPRSLRVGQKLKVPPCKRIVRSSRSRRRNRTHPRSGFYMGNYVATNTGKAVYRPNSSDGNFHVVRKGETLSGIAKRERVSFLTLYDVNRQTLKNNPNFIREGIRLRVPIRQ